MASSTEDRRFEVLRAIVADYVATKEPIGSKSLVERHNLGVSSATIRNDMAVLEAEGYITQPHTSSGRIPTDKGYREFVDRIAEVVPFHERLGADRFLGGDVVRDDRSQDLETSILGTRRHRPHLPRSCPVHHAYPCCVRTGSHADARSVSLSSLIVVLPMPGSHGCPASNCHAADTGRRGGVRPVGSVEPGRELSTGPSYPQLRLRGLSGSGGERSFGLNQGFYQPFSALQWARGGNYGVSG